MSEFWVDTIKDKSGTGSPNFPNGFPNGLSMKLLALAGSVSAPEITSETDTDTGIHFPSPNTLDIVTGGQTRFRVDENGRLYSVYDGDIGTDYRTTLHAGWLCRAWVNFNGTGTVAIRASGNVSSITDNNTGDYTINFATALPDANYAVGGMGTNSGGLSSQFQFIADSATPRTSSLVRINTTNVAGVPFDSAIVSLEVFR